MSERTIRSIIEGRQPVIAGVATTVMQAAQAMREANVGAIMVVDDNRLVGVFTERDALFRVAAHGLDAKTSTLAEVMTREPQTIAPDCHFAQALQMMHDGKFRHVPVVEHDGCVVGMVSARDALGPELEGFVYELLRQEQVNEVLA
ncbi:MAG: cyclic nucleotide-binding/CBS domain-containing protein [Rhodospirillaceae bacterium]